MPPGRSWVVFCYLIPCFLVLSSPAISMQKLSDAELREVTGKSGFINSKEDLEQLNTAKNLVENLVRSQGLEEFLSDKTRDHLLKNAELSPNKQAKLLQKTTRDLLTNPEFLRQVKETTEAIIQLGKALQQIQSLR